MTKKNSIKLDPIARNRWIIILCSILFNVVSTRLLMYGAVPLTLDAVGCIVVVGECGLFYGIFTALITSVLCGTFYSASFYNAIVNIVVVMLAAIMFYRNVFQKKFGGLLFLVGISAAGGVAATIVEILLNWGYVYNLFQGFLWYTADKFLSVCLALIVIRLIPEKIRRDILESNLFLNKLASDDDYQNALNEKGRRERHRKLLGMLVAEAVGLTVIVAFVSMRLYIENTRIMLQEEVWGTAELVAATVNPEFVDAYLEEGEAAVGYAETEALLQSILNKSPAISYVYVYQIKEDGCHVVFDTDTETVPGEEVGTVLALDESLLTFREAILAGEYMGVVESRDSWGWMVSAYYPIYDAEGNCVAYAGADATMDGIYEFARYFLMRVMLISAGFLILTLSFGLWMSNENYAIQEWKYKRVNEAVDEAKRRQDAFPGKYVPRDPHADQYHHRHGRNDPAGGCIRGAGGLCR